jgi:hypothetical protein
MKAPVTLLEMVEEFHTESTSFNLPASTEDLSDLKRAFNCLPDQALLLYKDHNGSDQIPQVGDRKIAARLMPIKEVIETQAALTVLRGSVPTIESPAWLWTDDNSNYIGLYTDGPLRGWLCILNHEEPILTPAFRSIESFMYCLLSEARRKGSEGAYDIPSLPREIPELLSDGANDESDMQLALLFREQYRIESGEDMRRLYALCSICLIPVENTAEIAPFLEDPDMWVPEAAVRLFELRGWKGPTEQLEKLAREGHPNGDTAAMRLLVRMNTDESRSAIARLRQSLQGQKLKQIEMWARTPLQPPRW